MEGTVFNIQRMSVQDGPGIRTTVFLKGCGLRCFWCHNPESLSPSRQIGVYPDKCIGCGACAAACPSGARQLTQEAGLSYDRGRCAGCGACAQVCYAGSIQCFGSPSTPEEVCREACRDREFYGREGGVTFSGGEPLLQWEFTAACARLCREQGLHVAVDTSLFAPAEGVKALLERADLFLIDCKAATPALHQKGTGQDNRLIQQHTRMVAASQTPYWVRIPLIPGFNDSREEMRRIGDFLSSLSRPPERVELMPFHNFCSAKYQSLGMDFAAAGLPLPTPEQVSESAGLLRDRGLKVKNCQ